MKYDTITRRVYIFKICSSCRISFEDLLHMPPLKSCCIHQGIHGLCTSQIFPGFLRLGNNFCGVRYYTLSCCAMLSVTMHSAAHCHCQHSKLGPWWNILLLVHECAHPHLFRCFSHAHGCIHTEWNCSICHHEVFFNTWQTNEVIVAINLQNQSVLLVFIAIKLHYLCFCYQSCDFFSSASIVCFKR